MKTKKCLVCCKEIEFVTLFDFVPVCESCLKKAGRKELPMCEQNVLDCKQNVLDCKQNILDNKQLDFFGGEA